MQVFFHERRFYFWLATILRIDSMVNFKSDMVLKYRKKLKKQRKKTRVCWYCFIFSFGKNKKCTNQEIILKVQKTLLVFLQQSFCHKLLWDLSHTQAPVLGCWSYLIHPHLTLSLAATHLKYLVLLLVCA